MTTPMPAKKLDSRAAIAQNFVFYYMIIMGSSSGELTSEDLAFALQYGLQTILDNVSKSALNNPILGLNLDFVSTQSALTALNDGFQTRRGRSFLQRLAFDQVGYKDRLAEAILHAFVSLIHHTAMADGIPDDVEPEIWDALRATLDDFEKKNWSKLIS